MIKSIGELIEILKILKDQQRYYRGHAQYGWALLPSIFREEYVGKE